MLDFTRFTSRVEGVPSPSWRTRLHRAVACKACQRPVLDSLRQRQQPPLSAGFVPWAASGTVVTTIHDASEMSHEAWKGVEGRGGRDPGQRPNQAALVRPSTREGLAAALALKSVPVQGAALLRTTTGEKSEKNARNRLRMWFKHSNKETLTLLFGSCCVAFLEAAKRSKPPRSPLAAVSGDR